MKKLLIAFLLFAAAISASIIKPVERLATENNKVRLSRITVDSARLEEYNAYLKEENLQDGVCGYRELENWVRTFQAIKDVRRAAQVAVISKATMDPEEQEHLMKTYVEPYC